MIIRNNQQRRSHRTGRQFAELDEVAEVVLDLSAAAKGSRYRVVTTPKLREWFPITAPAWVPRRHVISLRDWLGHLWLIPFVISNRQADLILIKGFRTNLLLISFCLLWPWRQKLLAVIHHNLQLAYQNRYERRLAWMFRAGGCFAFLESNMGLRELGFEPNPKQFVTLPIPIMVTQNPPRLASNTDKEPIIGVIGRDLKEKKTDDLLEHLYKLHLRGELPGQLLFASDNEELLELWESRQILTRNTRSYQEYLRALKYADIAVLGYDRSHYYYRSSGVISDAVAMGAAVVCPDFPVFRSQVKSPAAVGAVYASAAEICDAILAAIDIARTSPQNFEAWVKSRSHKAFGEQLDNFIEIKGRSKFTS